MIARDRLGSGRAGLRMARPLSMLALALAAALGGVPAAALTVDEARHLLTRTGFGASPEEIRALLPLSRREAVDRIVGSLASPDADPPPPAFVNQPVHADYVHRLGEDYAPAAMMGPTGPVADDIEADKALDYKGMNEMAQLRAWWLDRMISSRTPFYERLALFWHGHFTTKYFDVLGPRLLYDQLQTIRREGSRNFGTLLSAMLRDPAMLIFLDNAISTKRRPNENLARELMELFTLGVGNYSEDDVKAMARILSGNSVDFAGEWRFTERQAERDDGVKNFLGHEGRWRVEDAVRFLLQNPQTARFIANKFYREFVSSEPDAAEIERLATALRAGDYDIPSFLRVLLAGDKFWSPTSRGQLVKSPIELEVGFVRTFGYAMPDVSRLADQARLFGQELFEPPSVQGWKVGMTWLNPGTVNERSDELSSLWMCRGAVSRWLASGPDDLLVRYSAEREGAAPVQVAVRVDGREIMRAEAECPAGRIVAGQAGGKPAWDLLVIPRDRLPRVVGKVEVVFERRPGQIANLFVNWIALDGRRHPAYAARQVYDAGAACRSEQAPKGMLYCPGRIAFDLQASAGPGGEAEATLVDRSEGPVNSVIESATARLPLRLSPAGASAAILRTDPAIRWRGLPLQEAILAAPPILARPAKQDIASQIETMISDPAYNLQ